MSRRNIIITDSDRRRLEDLLASEFAVAFDPKTYLADLQAELHRAQIVDSADVPSDVITMDSMAGISAMAWWYASRRSEEEEPVAP